MIATALEATAVPLLLGGLISPLQALMMGLFLGSAGFIFSVIKDQVEPFKAIGVAGGLYIFSVALTLILL